MHKKICTLKQVLQTLHLTHENRLCNNLLNNENFNI